MTTTAVPRTPLAAPLTPLGPSGPFGQLIIPPLGTSAGPLATTAGAAGDSPRLPGALTSRPLPTLREMLRHAMPAIVEGSVAPFVVFAIALRVAGMSTALIAALACAYGAFCWRMATGRRPSGMLMVSMAMLTIKTAVAAATGSLAVYFVPPVITAAATALVFLGSAALGRPLAWRIANDFWAMPEEAIGDRRVHRLFVRMSLMFGAVYLTKGAFTAWLLLSMPMEEFVIARGVCTLGMMASSAVVAMWWARVAFTRMRREDMVAEPLVSG